MRAGDVFRNAPRRVTGRLILVALVVRGLRTWAFTDFPSIVILSLAIFAVSLYLFALSWEHTNESMALRTVRSWLTPPEIARCHGDEYSKEK
jgi:hypothetical protein